MESEKELFQHYRFVADKGQDPLRVDKFLINFIENASRSKIQQSAKDGYIHVNGLPVKANYKVKSGDVVTVEYKNPPRDHKLIPQDIPINILYEDDTTLTVNNDEEMREAKEDCDPQCFDLVYPVTFIMPDGSIITVGRKEEVEPFSLVEYMSSLTEFWADLSQAWLMIILALKAGRR